MILNNRLRWLVFRSCEHLFLIISVHKRRPLAFSTLMLHQHSNFDRVHSANQTAPRHLRISFALPTQIFSLPPDLCSLLRSPLSIFSA